MSTLLIDAGSTKMDWALLENGIVTKRFATKGFNPNYAEKQQFINILSEVDLPKMEVEKVFYYGSGCLKVENAQMVGLMLQQYFPNSVPTVTNDMMGAAHALLGHNKGIACILGTGANSCLYDGNVITNRAVSLGYLVGDEGSGCYIGKKLVRAYFYNLFPIQLKLEFEDIYNLNINDFIDNVYHKPEASKYLANFTKFAGEHQEDPFIQQLVNSCFRDFIEVFVLRYSNYHSLPIGFVGSVAYHFQGLLKKCLEAEGLSVGQIIQSPLEGLISYHNVD